MDTLNLLKAETESIFAAVKPPKKEEPPKEDVKMEESKPEEATKPADAEMQNEEAKPEESKQWTIIYPYKLSIKMLECNRPQILVLSFCNLNLG